MSDPNDPNSPDYVDPDDPDAPQPREAPEQTGAVYPVNDGQGGTAFVIGNTDEQATAEQWAAQNGVALPADEEVEYDDEGNPIARDDEPEEVEYGTIQGTEAEKVSAVAAAVDDAT